MPGFILFLTSVKNPSPEPLRGLVSLVMHFKNALKFYFDQVKTL